MYKHEHNRAENHDPGFNDANFPHRATDRKLGREVDLGQAVPLLLTPEREAVLWGMINGYSPVMIATNTKGLSIGQVSKIWDELAEAFVPEDKNPRHKKNFMALLRDKCEALNLGQAETPPALWKTKHALPPIG